MTCHFLLVNLTYESRKFVCEKKNHQRNAKRNINMYMYVYN